MTNVDADASGALSICRSRLQLTEPPDKRSTRSMSADRYRHFWAGRRLVSAPGWRYSVWQHQAQLKVDYAWVAGCAWLPPSPTNNRDRAAGNQDRKGRGMDSSRYNLGYPTVIALSSRQLARQRTNAAPRVLRRCFAKTQSMPLLRQRYYPLSSADCRGIPTRFCPCSDAVR